VSSAPIFAALGDETRLKIVARLCTGGPQSIARLTVGSDITRQGVTKHLLVLADAGLIRSERQGRERRFAIQAHQLDIARRYLDLISAEWSRRLAALASHLDAMPEQEPRRRRKK
jgi:DNA-binding transcriptional ArsR family regulator